MPARGNAAVAPGAGVEIGSHVAALEREGGLLVDAARRAGPDAPVPTCPGWRVEDLLAHMGFVHRWAAMYVAGALAEMVPEPPEAEILAGAPAPGTRPTWVAAGHAELVRALRAAPADLECWTFLPAPSPLAMWARRQAHETAVHRVDAELAALAAPGSAQGRVTPLDPAFAADGVDELLLGFFGRPGRPPTPGDAQGGGDPADRRAAATGTIALVPDDRPERWTVRLTPAGVAPARGLFEHDVAVRAGAGDLYLLLWHRRSPEGLDVTGPAGRFEALWGSRGVTWG